MVKIRSGEKQLWRVLNASAITYLDVQMMAENKPQMMGVVSLDGIPINENGMARNRIIWESHVLLPPAGRVDMIVKGPPEGARASFVTRTVDTGPAGENDPHAADRDDRRGESDAPEPGARLAASPVPLPRPTSVWLGDVKPVRTRTLYFSEQPHDPATSEQPDRFFHHGRRPGHRKCSIRAIGLPTSSRSRETWRTGSSKTARRNSMHFISISPFYARGMERRSRG